MIRTFTEKTVLQFKVMPPLYIPFLNLAGAEDYYKYAPFDLDPFTLWAGPTSGSPIVIAGGSFFGFLNESGGRFAYDGRGVLTVTCPAGQALYCEEDCNPYAAWGRYSAAVLQQHTAPAYAPQAFWGGLEYCTWVEQKRFFVQGGSVERQIPLSEDFVYDYMRRVDAMKMPRGKLTIDDGWDIRFAPDGRKCYGNWQIDRQKFPRMERLVRDMKEDGFEPGLWFAPFMVTPNCTLAQTHPQLLGEVWDTKIDWGFLLPDDLLEEYYTQLFTPYIQMGFRKFKLDIAYGPKADMKRLLAMMYRIIKQQDPAIEVECHVPDIFVSRFCDTVRLNDVNFEQNWRMVTAEHYRVCRHSAPDKILNLDHMGTNTPIPKAEDYLEHSKMLLSLEGGYPCVSLLPDLFGTKVTDTYTGMVREWCEKNDR